jgi:cytochrome c553
MKSIAFLVPFLVSIFPGAAAEYSEGEKLFVQEIRPIFAEKCLACHGDKPNKLKGDYDMRTRATLLKGGESGDPAIIPDKPDESPLYIAVTWKDSDLEMPPKENDRLDQKQIAFIKKWIELGAPWINEQEAGKVPVESKDGRVTVKTSGGTTAAWTNRRYRPEDIWAYQPLTNPEVPKHPGISHPVDAFIHARLKEAGLKPAPRDDARTLRRRVTYGLTGLPPDPEKANQNGSWEKLVDELLASPRYGERMAQHWLDVVRYADTAGFANDWERPHAWRYRDYVIRSFNQDKPFNQFTKEQIAGDEVSPKDPAARIATGFLRMGPWEHTAMSVAAVTRQQFLDDATNSIGETFLAQGLKCASCHDHKFDPIPTRDYYRLQAALAPTQFAEPAVPFQKWESREFEKRRTHLKNIQATGPEMITKLDKEDSFGRIKKKRADYLKNAFKRFSPSAFSVKSAGTPKTRILTGGSIESPGEGVSPGVLSVSTFSLPVPTSPQGRRRALAEWIASDKNPLTARVIVNRVWQWHFGTGLVASANNFGKMGGPPSHPELLDWLAGWFIENNWSLKKLHRLILTSETYRRSNAPPDPVKVGERDPNNRLLSWFPPRRLTAEEIRDSMLMSSGELDHTMGGPGVFPFINEEVALQPRHIMGGIAMPYQASPTRSLRNRRSIYVFRIRTLADPSMEVFNKPGPDASCEKRDETIVTPQVFTLFNGQTARDRAVALAQRIANESSDQSTRIEHAFQFAYGRTPTAKQKETALKHLADLEKHHRSTKSEQPKPATSVRRQMVAEQSGELFEWKEHLITEKIEPDLKMQDLDNATKALADLCLVLFNSSEFLYVY